MDQLAPLDRGGSEQLVTLDTTMVLVSQIAVATGLCALETNVLDKGCWLVLKQWYHKDAQTTVQ